ncbi:hypothetical protein PLESTB_001024100 [Pleodorina starrii]|uniref:Uncharacterized protein n=1 Tax=Pleodorina starrii TaxID=330485 RepID=A0A9W6BP78_9CHLO|nr:hypothetical protein PLESTM_001818000 [Pleodorina starrii]GLC55744.1 hypothetical protein PLESTB_001024100 [Pleodorina starrii]GLC68816.1 hypothetical protein PLESTF_000741600 [Pleodorina starrii]
MADEILPRGAQLRGPQAYAKNPLFQQDAMDALRTAQVTGQIEASDRAGSLHMRNNAEDALGPFLESLRQVQGDPMYRAFSEQMDTLYQVFKELHEQDQGEIRRLLFTLESQKQQLQQLSTENDTVRQQLRSRERELAASTMAAAAAAALNRDLEQQQQLHQQLHQQLQQQLHQQQQMQQQQQMLLGAVPPGAAGAAVTAGLSASPPHESQRGGGQGGARQRGSPRLQAGLNQPAEAQEAEAEAGGGGRGGRAAMGVQGAGGGPVMAVPLQAAAPTASGGGGEGMWRGGDRVSGRERSGVTRRWRRPYFILFLPYMLHPAHHCWRFYATWQSSWTARRTLWLAVAWVLVFLLSVGLLVGLLVPWDRLTQPRFTAGPEVVALGAAHVSLRMALNRKAEIYYVVVPEAYARGVQAGRRRLAGDFQTPSPAVGRNSDATAAIGSLLGPGPGSARALRSQAGSWRRAMAWLSARRQTASGKQDHDPGDRHRRGLAAAPSVLQLGDVEADDVRDIAEGSGDTSAALFPFAVACGQVDVHRPDTNFTLTVRNGVPLWLGSSGGNATAGEECTASFGMQPNGTVLPTGAAGPFFARRCLRCPWLLPGTPYVALLFGDGGRKTGVVQVSFTTSAASSPPPPPA